MIIKINDVIYEPITLYRKAKTPAQRALVGYMTKAGCTNNTIFGGAFRLLRDIEYCMDVGEIYELYSLVDNETKKKIIHVTQIALDGKLDRFAISERERNETMKNLCQPL